jgi:hypothetical protein
VPHYVGKLGFVAVDPAVIFANVLLTPPLLELFRRRVLAVSSFYWFVATCEYPSLASRAFYPPLYGLKRTVERNKAFLNLGLQHTMNLRFL